MGWTRRSAWITVCLAMEEERQAEERQRKQAGLRLVELREAKGWNQEDLAHAAKVSVKTVSRLENGVQEEPRRATVRKVAAALDVDDTVIRPLPAAPSLNGSQSKVDQILSAVEELGQQVAALLRRFPPEDEPPAGGSPP